jgi:hypothetical protein
VPRSRLQLHVLRPNAPVSTPPERGEPFEVEAQGLDDLRTQARDALVRKGYRARAFSFTPTGMVDYVEASL